MPRILVVDDQKIPRLAVTSILEEAGHEVSAAESGEEGLALAADLSPDVIILDVYMPGMDGFAVVERLKSDPRTEPTPVIFLTAEPPTDDLVVRGLDLGAYDFLSKGCSRAELLARVGVMARIKRGNDELSAVARISDTLIQTLDPEKLSRHFLAQLREVFRAQAALLAYSRNAGLPATMSIDGFEADPPLVEALVATVHETLAELADDRGEIPATAFRGAAAVAARRFGFGSALAARVDNGDRPPTLLVVFTRRDEGFARQGDAPLLHLLARQATIALDNAVLHERTRSQASAMEEQAEKLERAMTERSRFFASMSHELRTPINAVIGYNQLLEMGAYGDMSEEQTVAVDRVGRSAQHLLELINDILDISKIEAGKMEINAEPADLSLLLKETLTTVQIQAEEKGLSLRLSAPPEAPVETDAARVRQILLNLLSNAVKFTDSGGSIDVQLRTAGEGYAIDVRDTGVGIREEDFDRVFEEFEQTHRVTSPSGTGLGLPISKRLASLLGGELSLTSEVGVGSTFTLHLPIRPIHPHETSPE
jgi:signal transduction histidine kinase/DNA-binding NarL/FixJ family response regulator